MIDTILQGDCKEVLKQFEDNYFDAICTDPPYELAFMGKKWDASGIAYDINVWRECLRVLKPGGHMLAFGGTRTYHRMACAIEDAGFEIRDTISWTFGSGFPKSLSIDKAIDKYFKADREIIGENPNARPNSQTAYSLDGENANFRATYQPITAPSTPAAKQWSGFGTALKPAHEMICLARKPLACKTIAENVLAYGCGGLNIDASRVDSGQPRATGTKHQNKPAAPNDVYGKYNSLTNQLDYDANLPAGRFPSNLIWSHSPLCKQIGETWDCHPSCPTWEFAKAGEGKSRMSMRGLAGRHDPGQGAEHNRIKPYSNSIRGHDDQGTPARFFKSCSYTPDDIPAFMYYAKASKSERGEGNNHPTVKSLSLMKYLVKLITPPGGLILDPFSGSGTTLLAAKSEGFHCVGIEKEAEYVAIANKRLAAVPETLSTYCQ